MFRSRLGDSSIIYGAEMDGFQLIRNDVTKSIDEIDLSSDGHFVEMKTSRLIENDRQQNSFCRYKTQKWWAQSFMVRLIQIQCVLDIRHLDIRCIYPLYLSVVSIRCMFYTPKSTTYNDILMEKVINVVCFFKIGHFYLV
jgi:hypothetical protein